MSKFSALKSRDIIRALQKVGFAEHRQREREDEIKFSKNEIYG